MAKFRKKPIVVEAEQWFPGKTVPGVCTGPCARNDYLGWAAPHVHTVHQGGGQTVPLEPGDWVIAEPDGSHFYPCKPDIFAETYEPADAAQRPAVTLDELAAVAEQAWLGWQIQADLTQQTHPIRGLTRAIARAVAEKLGVDVGERDADAR